MWVLLFALSSCKGQEGPQQKVSEYYSSLAQGSVGATVTADSGVIMEYELSVSWEGEESQCTVVSPEEIAGVSCHISQEGATLQFEDVQLDTLLAPIRGFTSAHPGRSGTNPVGKGEKGRAGMHQPDL